MKVCVVGAGIVGAATACHLATHDDVEVVLLDESGAGNGTTDTSFAWGCAHPHEPREYFELNHEGMKEYQSLRRMLGGDAEWYFPGGALCVGSDHDELRKRAARVNEWGDDVREISMAEALERFPALDLHGLSSPAFLFAGDFSVDAKSVTERMVSLANGTGRLYPLYGVRAAALRATASGGWRVELANGAALEVDAVVNAAGTRSDVLAATAGRKLPLAPSEGLVVRLSAGADAVPSVVLSDDVDLRPDRAGTVRVHHPDVDARLADPGTELDVLVRDLVAKAVRLCPPLADAGVQAVWRGVRPMPADGYSSIGSVAGLPGYYEAVTHSGVTLGPLIGRLLATELVTGSRSPLLAPYSPERFEGAINE